MIEQEYVFLTNKQWEVIDGEPCKVIDFRPLARIQDGHVAAMRGMPYAAVTLECKKFPRQVTGFISHRIDFLHLWTAFQERGVRSTEEVVIFWTKRQLKPWARWFSVIMPHLWVMICPKGAFELLADSEHRPDLVGMARVEASHPIIDWKPQSMI